VYYNLTAKQQTFLSPLPTRTNLHHLSSMLATVKLDPPRIGVPKCEKGVVGSPKTRGTGIVGDGEELHPAHSGGLGISGHSKKPQFVHTEYLSDTAHGTYGPVRYFKGTEIKSYCPATTFKVCSSSSSFAPFN